MVDASSIITDAVTTAALEVQETSISAQTGRKRQAEIHPEARDPKRTRVARDICDAPLVGLHAERVRTARTIRIDDTFRYYPSNTSVYSTPHHVLCIRVGSLRLSVV